MGKDILLNKEQFDYINKLVEEHYYTYFKFNNVSAIYLSTYRDENERPIIEVTLVTDWLKSVMSKNGKVLMAPFACPYSYETDEEPIYILSMADVNKYKSVIEDNINEDDSYILADMSNCNSILLDREGICTRLFSLANAQSFIEGNGKVKCYPPLMGNVQ